MILAERAARLAAEAGRSGIQALIAPLKLQIEKLRRDLYGTRSERKARLLDQMQSQLEELVACASEDKEAAEPAAFRAGPAPVPAHQLSLSQALSRTPAARAGGDPCA